MAEIKSAIELAMERTKNLVMDEEEKRALARKELDVRVRGVVRRHLEGLTGVSGFRGEFENLKGDDEEKKTVLLAILFEELDLRRENGVVLDLLDVVNGRLDPALREELHSIRRQFLEEMASQEDGARGRILERLSMAGISGEGIEPNLEAWPEWQESMDETNRALQHKVESWKERASRAVNLSGPGGT